jgi:hypothetical protein
MPFGTRRCAPVHVAPLHCRDDGKRTILGVSCALSDAHTGLKAALRAACNASPWQRCQFHLQQNAGHLVTAVLVEISEAWESGKSYLKPQN